MKPDRLKIGVGYCHHKRIKKIPRTQIKKELWGQIVNADEEIIPDKKPCTFCGHMLESAMPDEDWSTLQPYGGGEVQFIFSFGSCKFDNSFHSTVFRGLICDECGERFVDKMELNT